MERRKLQFFRSSTIYANRDTALANVEAFKATQLSGMSDGEIVLFRYTSKTGSIEAIIGCVINKNGNLDLSLVDVGELDVDNIEKSFSDIIASVGLSGSTTGGEDGKSNIGYAPYVDNKYISGCTTMECAVNTLSDALEDEETARIESDNSLNDKIDAEIQYRIDADDVLSGKIDTEIQDRIDGDNALSGVVDNIIESVGLESDGTFNGFDGGTIVSGSNSVIGAIETISDVIIQNEEDVSSALNDLNERVDVVSGNVDTISGEVSSLSSDLSQETRIRETNDNNIILRVNGLQDNLYNTEMMVARIISGVGLVLGDGSFRPFTDELLSGASGVCDAISIVSETILDNELVVSSALNDLNSRILDMDLATVSGNGKVVVSVSETDGKVNATLGNVNASDVIVTPSGFTGTTVQSALSEIASKASTLSSSGKTVVVTTGTSGTNVEANIDGTTIVKDNNGVLSSGLQIAKITDNLDANVSEEYRLIYSGDTSKTQIGDAIQIKKDSSLYQAYLGHTDDELSGGTPTVIPGTGDTALCFIYLLYDGTYDLVNVDIETLLDENEFKDGLYVDDHKVYVKIDTNSEKVVTGNGVSGDVLTVSSGGTKISNIQNAIDYKVSTLNSTASGVSTDGTVTVTVGESNGVLTGVTVETDYSANTGSPYISAATSLNDADVLLDSTAQSFETRIAALETRITELETALDNANRVVAEALNDLNFRLLSNQGV